MDFPDREKMGVIESRLVGGKTTSRIVIGLAALALILEALSRIGTRVAPVVRWFASVGISVDNLRDVNISLHTVAIAVIAWSVVRLFERFADVLRMHIRSTEKHIDGIVHALKQLDARVKELEKKLPPG